MRAILALILTAFAVANSGCTLLVSSQLKGKFPFRSADEASAAASIPIVGGGSVTVTGLKKQDDGSLFVGTFNEDIQTGYGTLKITAKNAVIDAPKPSVVSPMVLPASDTPPAIKTN
jgi:hypothetical protein